MTGESINEDISVIPEDFPGKNLSNASISTITYAIGLPEMTTRILTGVKIGLPATLEKNGQIMFDGNLNNEEYNSSVELGPLQTPPGMNPDINVDEDKVVAATTELENNNINPEQYLVLTNAIIEVIKVKDLNNALGDRNLNKGPLKAVLITRLKQAFEN